MKRARSSALYAAASALVFAVLPQARGDEAVLRGGRIITGTFALDGQRRLRFTADGKALPTRQIEQIRLSGQPTPFRAAALHEALFRSGERLTGELLSLDAGSLRLRPAWKDEVQIPRHALTGLAHFADQVTVFAEDFEKDLSLWKLTGAPARSERQQTSGRHSLCLAAPGQEAAYCLTRPIPAGRIGVNFCEAGAAAGARCLLVAEFAGAKDPVGVVLAGGSEHCAVETSLAAEEVAPAPRTPGWHRLSLRFASDYVLVGVDDVVVWSSAKAGPGGPLRKVTLRCEALADEKSGGGVYFDDFSLARPADGPAHRTGDDRQDDVWLLSGDQLFGQVTRADRRVIELETRPGPQVLSWADVRGVYFRLAEEAPRHTSQGEHVRIGLRPGRGAGLDELEGVLVAVDERRVVLRHDELGELTIERPRLAQVRPLFFGERRALDNGFHHLGPPGESSPRVRSSRAEGPTLTCRFRLGAVPAGARLSLQVAHWKGFGDGSGPALERGERRTEVVVNGRPVDDLNRHRGRSSRQLHRMSLRLPAGTLRAGDNTLELRQTPQRDTGRVGHCIVHGIVLELISAE